MNKSRKQPKDMTQVEKDEFDIHRFYQRKNKAEAVGKVYKPRFTGNIKRLLEQYPEEFPEYAVNDNPVIIPVTNKEVEELREQLAIQEVRLEHQTRLSASQGERIRGLVKEGNHHKYIINKDGRREVNHSKDIREESRVFIQEQRKTIDKQASQIRYFKKMADSTGREDLEKELIKLRKELVKERADRTRTSNENGSLRARVNYYTKQEKLNSK